MVCWSSLYMARKLISKRMEMFSSCLLYTCETVSHMMVAAVRREHHLPDHNTASSPTDQHRTGGISTRQWLPAGSANQVPASGKATIECSSFSTPGSANVQPWPVWYSIFH